MKLTGAQIVWEALRRENVEVVFGYPGGAALPIYDALVDSPIRHVLVRHEQGAAHMADGYARASGKTGVVLSTSGPGATNLVTGIVTAQMDSVPLVCITGQVGSSLIGYDAFQETDIVGITLPVTKHNYLVTDAHDIAPAIHEAFYIAREGKPGPVLIDITKDAQQTEIEWEFDLREVSLPGFRPDLSPLPSDYERAATLVRSAQRPLILAGHGVLISAAMDEVRTLAERIQAPVASTLLGLGAFPDAHPLSIGLMGMHGAAWVNQSIQNADLLLAFGMRFDDRVTGNLAEFAPNARTLHIEIDPSEVNKNVQADVALIGDLKTVLLELLPLLEPAQHPEWLKMIADWKSAAAAHEVKHLPHDGRLYPAHVISDLWQATNGEALLVSDVGQNQMWAAQYYPHALPRTAITSGGLGTMGFGLPAAIGAKIACPEKEVWVIVGDGGFQMTQAELSTAMQEGIKIHIAILNNGYLGMVRQWQELFYDRRYSYTPMLSPDFVKIAEAHGLKGLRVTRREEVAAAIQEARDTAVSVLIDFRIEGEDNVYPMVPTGKAIDQMIRRPLRPAG